VSPTQPPNTGLPLFGVRVLELGQLIAGPFAGQLLGCVTSPHSKRNARPCCFRHFGAEIIKVEPPNTGDPLRGWRELDVDGTSPWFRSLARNKKSVSIDLRKEEGRVYVSLFIFPHENSKSGNKNNFSNRLVRRLAEHSDVVLENFKPGSTCSPILPFATSLLT
jgi:crotonobetainyl-CoA:carnitine CoA-transferase CaiB-like acyl-CoA transferase